MLFLILQVKTLKPGKVKGFYQHCMGDQLLGIAKGKVKPPVKVLWLSDD